jgi:hypothetical protein
MLFWRGGMAVMTGAGSVVVGAVKVVALVAHRFTVFQFVVWGCSVGPVRWRFSAGFTEMALSTLGGKVVAGYTV